MKSKEDIAIDIVNASGSIIRTAEALERGIHPRTFYSLRDKGILVELSRGIYQLSDDHVEDIDLAVVAAKIPKGVICLISALSFHEITTQIPHTVSIALIKGAEARTGGLDKFLQHRKTAFFSGRQNTL